MINRIIEQIGRRARVEHNGDWSKAATEFSAIIQRNAALFRRGHRSEQAKPEKIPTTSMLWCGRGPRWLPTATNWI
jgi:hypothetical protein